MKLIKKTYLQHSGKVYDIKVSTPDHSYIINNAVVHNSAAGSLIARLFNITKVDPLEYGLLFERFLNEGRVKVSCPDIDTDFESTRRPDVKRYMEQKYGHDKVCSIGAYTTLQMRAVFRDFSKLENVPIATIEYISKMMFETRDNKNARASKAPWEYIFTLASRNATLYKFIQEHSQMVEDTWLCHAQPRAASVHPCATLILPQGESIYTSIPVRLGEIDGEKVVVSEWEGPALEHAGYLKEDILGISQLDKFRMIVDLVEKNYGEKVDIYSIPLEQKEVFEMFGKGECGDVFHLGSKGLTSYCIQVKPTSVRELCAMLALYRPGPMEGNFHNEYVELKNGRREVTYMPGLEDITKETFGLLAYQEQIMRICTDLADFTLVEADNIRKGMGKVNRKFFAEQGEKFFAGALKNGYDKEYLEELWGKMCSFGGYAFNKCLCGDTKLMRYANNKKGKSSFHPTIAEMYKIRHDKEFAKTTGHEELHWKYKQKGYGTCWSLNENNLLVKNNIKDIYYQGVRDCYTLTTESGRQITCTDNHKFPTSNGKKKLSEISIDTDLIFVSSGWKSKDTTYRFGTGKNYPRKGQKGFQETEGPSSQFQKFINEIASRVIRCECCGRELVRKEIHHIDGNHGNNDSSNLEVLCPSCHKKRHYEMGRTKCGEAGIETHFEKIVSIEYVGQREVYDVEMADPYHTLTIENGIVTSNSHALCYAITGYYCQYLKWRYPLPYWITALEFASDENVLRFISEINKTGKIKVSPPDINKSQLKFNADFDKSEIIWSISKVKQCGEVAVSYIFEERQKNGEFFSFEEFLSRVDKSKVNKSVIENLILAGAFDTLEDLKYPSHRKILIDKYRQLMSVKVDKSKDWFEKAKQESKLHEDWWWLLQQKKVSGLAFFDFKTLASQYEKWFPLQRYIEVDELQNTDIKDLPSTMVVVGGVISEIETRNSKKGDYFKIRIESNYSFVWLTIWSDIYPKYFEELHSAEGKLVLVKAKAYYDTFKLENALQSDDKMEILVLE